MVNELEKNIAFALKKKLEDMAPNNFVAIREAIAAKIASELLEELEGVPGFEGRLISEKREVFVEALIKKGA